MDFHPMGGCRQNQILVSEGAFLDAADVRLARGGPLLVGGPERIAAGRHAGERRPDEMQKSAGHPSLPKTQALSVKC
jgi:hypothetical protein